MHGLIGAVLAATPTPSPSPTVDPQLVTPGPWGFAVIAFLAVAVILLVWDMLRRIRRVKYREEVAAELDAEQAAARAEASTQDRSDADDPDAAAPEPDSAR